MPSFPQRFADGVVGRDSIIGTNESLPEPNGSRKPVFNSSVCVFGRLPAVTPEAIHSVSAHRGELRQRDTRTNRVSCILLAATGLRLGEALGIVISKDTILDDCTRIVIRQKAWRNEIQDFLKTPNGDREVDLHPSVAAMLKEFIGGRTCGLLFQTKGGKPLCQTNLLKRHLHASLLGNEKNGIKGITGVKAGFHGFRRFRNTYLRNFTSCPDGPRIFWLGWSGKDMSDHYDKIREDVGFRREVAERVGIGFELPSIVPNVPKQIQEAVLP